MPTITQLTVHDIRFPTSRSLDGSDAMNTAPYYSAAYVVLDTDDPHGLAGHGLAFTCGRGNEIVVTAVQSLASRLVGLSLEHIVADMGAFWRHMGGDSQLRWIGPEKGAIHLATAAIVNAVWDLWAKAERKPVWKLLVDMSPEALVRCLDFRFVTDALTPEEAIALLQRHAPTRALREREMLERGYPAYTTSAGWRSSSRGGSRSRPAPTTSSATRPSASASRPSAWPPASIATTASCSSSCCRRTPSISARSMRHASVA